jgi:uncharacterized damage-inducible protein DinB
MKPMIAVFLLCSSAAVAQPKPPAPAAPTLKSVLLAQLKSTHNAQEWFVPAIPALAGLTVEQAGWHPSGDNHSIAQLVNHLTFWDKRQLAKFKGEAASAYDGNNAETFVPIVDKAGWDAAVRQLDELMTAWESAVETADDAKLQSWFTTIAHISTHNAYHTGQILYIRKQQGSWDAAKGVK